MVAICNYDWHKDKVGDSYREKRVPGMIFVNLSVVDATRRTFSKRRRIWETRLKEETDDE